MSLKCSCLISPSIHFLLPTGEGDIFISDIYKFLLGAETMSCADSVSDVDLALCMWLMYYAFVIVFSLCL